MFIPIRRNANSGWRRSIGVKRLACKKKIVHHHAPYSSSASSPSILRNPLQWYVTKLDTHPVTTKGITSGLIAGSGDLFCQYLIANKKSTPPSHESDITNSGSYDKIRTFRFFILGSCLVAPIVHAWYGLLMTRIPGTGIKAIGKRLFFDQGLFSPIFLPTFITSLTVLEHIIPDDILAANVNGNDEEEKNHTTIRIPKQDLYAHLSSRLRNDVPPALLMNWGVWIPSMAFMFAFVPIKFQVLYSNCIGFFWNAWLSWRTHEGEDEEEER